MSTITPKKRIGIVGTGFIARGLMHALSYHPACEVSAVLSRRAPGSVADFPLDRSLLKQKIEEVIAVSDLVVECSGDVIHGTVAIEAVLKAGLPVVTMNSELQIVTGTQLTRMGTLIEAEGDQPGSLAALDLEVRDMGFEPVVYGNVKRFLNLNPNPEEMSYWSKRQGISLDQVTAFTDGTKVQIEQALVANGLGATIVRRNLSGIECKDLEDGAKQLGKLADEIGQPISDYVLAATAPAGVFIVAKHQEAQKPYLEYLKLGSGPYYVIVRPYHLCHLEIQRTIMNVFEGNTRYRFNNGQHPVAQVVAVAKRDIAEGELLRRGLGSFTVRGEAVKIAECPEGVPIGLLQDAKFRRHVKAGETIMFADVELPESRALELWRQTLEESVR